MGIFYMSGAVDNNILYWVMNMYVIIFIIVRFAWFQVN